MSKHTPGSWRYHGGWGQCVCAGRVIVASCRNTELTGEQCQANARLIAAAPDLLNACRVAMEACRDNLAMASVKDEHVLLKAFDACVAAIKKADNSCQ